MPRGRYVEPGFRERVIGTLATVFPWFPDWEGAARTSGMLWEKCSTPFVRESDGLLTAHAGILEIPVVIAGEERVVAGLHAVATRPEHQRRGYMRDCVERALAFADERYETVILTCETPEIYARFGFRVVPEFRFTCDAPPPCGAAAHRDLDKSDAADLDFLQTLLLERAPVSERLGVVRERDVFLFDTASRTLQIFPELGAVVWMRRRDDVLLLDDVVARNMPTLAQLLAQLDGPVSKVITDFAPDRLDAPFRAEQRLFHGEEYLMARGPFLADGVEVALPRSGRC